MPIRVTNPLTTGASVYGSPFRDPVNNVAQIPVNIANLTTAEIDAQGYIKPGLPLTSAGALVGVGEPVFGVTIEAIKLAKSNSDTDRTGTFDVTLCTHGNCNQDVMEDNLGRALTSDEVAGFGLAGSQLKLL